MHWLLTLIIFLASCASHQAGKHIYLTNNDQAQHIAQKFKLSLKDLKKANPGKKLKAGEWIFVPYQGPVLFNHQRDSYSEKYGSRIFSWPVPSARSISSSFGKRGRRYHDGIDIPAPKGSSVIAAADAKVLFSGRLRGYGRVVILSHYNDYHTVYAHLSRFFVTKGEGVSQGQVIGHVGNSGRSSGPHLHFEVRRKKKILNPIPFLRWVPRKKLAQN